MLGNERGHDYKAAKGQRGDPPVFNKEDGRELHKRGLTPIARLGADDKIKVGAAILIDVKGNRAKG